MGIGPAHWIAFLRLSSRSCWLMNGSFLQGKMHCPDEWWDCLGTCWEKVRRIAKGVLDQPVKSFVSRPAQVLCPHLSPPYLSSFAFSCHPPSSPSVSHHSGLSKEGREADVGSPSAGRRSTRSLPVTGSLPRCDTASNCLAVARDRLDQVYWVSLWLYPNPGVPLSLHPSV